MDFFSIHHLLVHIPVGKGGYDLSWIEAIGTLAGVICIWLASKEKISNYLFGLINVTLFALIFSNPTVCQLAVTTLFLARQSVWLVRLAPATVRGGP